MTKFSFVALAFALAGLATGCATTNADMSPSASPVLTLPSTDAPMINHSDAAGLASVPGYHSVSPGLITDVPEKR